MISKPFSTNFPSYLMLQNAAASIFFSYMNLIFSTYEIRKNVKLNNVSTEAHS